MNALVDSKLFRLLSVSDSFDRAEVESAYDDFLRTVIEVCDNTTDYKLLFRILTHTQVRLEMLYPSRTRVKSGAGEVSASRYIAAAKRIVESELCLLNERVVHPSLFQPPRKNDIPDFTDGKTAFYFGPLEYMQWAEELNPMLDYQVQGVPTAEGLVSLVTAESRLCVNANSKNKHEALDFVAYLTQRIYQDSITNGDTLLQVYDSFEYNIKNERMRPLYETYVNGVRIPIEDPQMKITYWDTVQELCIKIFDDMTADEAAAAYDKIQMEQIKTHKN